MTINFGELLIKAVGDIEAHYDKPEILPVSIIDIKRTDQTFDMNHHMSDPCPRCGAFRMQVGDWGCFGVCFICFQKEYDEHAD